MFSIILEFYYAKVEEKTQNKMCKAPAPWVERGDSWRSFVFTLRSVRTLMTRGTLRRCTHACVSCGSTPTCSGRSGDLRGVCGEREDHLWHEIRITASPGRRLASVSRTRLRSCDPRPCTDGVRAQMEGGSITSVRREETGWPVGLSEQKQYLCVCGRVDHTLPPTLNLPYFMHVCTWLSWSSKSKSVKCSVT